MQNRHEGVTNTASNVETPKISSRARLRNNMAWLASERVARLAIGVIVFGAVARKLGAESFGLLNYSAGLIAIFAAFSSLGMDGIVIRELMLHTDKKESILGTAATLRVIGTFFCIGFACLMSLRGASQGNVMLLTFIIGLGSFPMAMEVVDWWFQMRLESRYTVQAKFVGSLLGSAVKLILVAVSAPLIYFAAALAFDGLLIAGSFAWMYRRRHGPIGAWRFDSQVAKTILHDAWPLILSGLLVALYLQIEKLVVMEWLGKKTAGIYYAAARLGDIWGIIPAILSSTFYPRLVEWRARDPQGYAQRMQLMFDSLTASGLLVAVGAAVFGPLAIRLVYGQKFAGAEQILLFLALAAPFSFSGTARAQYMLLERVTIHHTPAAITGIIVNFAIAWFMIPKLGAVGAALGSLGGFFVSAYLISWAIPRLRPCARLQTRALLTPWVRLIKASRHT
jgi:O-antigen/teichoic acid export membrane protein